MLTLPPPLRRLLNCERGIAALEFVFLAPALLMLAFAIIIYSLWFTAQNGVREAAVEGARAAVTGLSTTERATLARTRALEVMAAHSSFTGGGTPVVTTAAVGSNGFSVTVSYNMSASPLMRYGAIVPLPAPNITATETVNNGSY